MNLWRVLLLLLLISTMTFSATVKRKAWESGMSLETYLKRHNVPTTLLTKLDEDDALLVSDIGNSRSYYELIASTGVLLQALIPVGEEVQFHLYKTHHGYKIEVIPIEYQEDTYVALLKIKNSPYGDIVKKTKNRRLASEFTRLLKHSVNFKTIKGGDKLAIVYTQKMRLGQPIGIPNIKAAMLETHGHKYYVFKHTNQKYYDENGKDLIKKYMQRPLNHIRITSPFTHRRYHPVLKRWKAHLGTDFGARRGTPILAAAAGRVIYSGWKGGYGKVIKIQHKDNYVTLYAHQSRLKVKVGEHVSAGQVIGYVGSTGRSTGAHLHFGLYKNGRAINPMKMVKFSTGGLTGYGKRRFLERKKKYTQIIDNLFKKNMPSQVWNTVHDIGVSPKMKHYYKSQGW